MFGFAAALARLANVGLVFGNRNNGFERGVHVFRQVTGLQALGFFCNGLEGLGDIICTHVFFLCEFDYSPEGRSLWRFSYPP